MPFLGRRQSQHAPEFFLPFHDSLLSDVSLALSIVEWLPLNDPKGLGPALPDVLAAARGARRRCLDRVRWALLTRFSGRGYVYSVNCIFIQHNE